MNTMNTNTNKLNNTLLKINIINESIMIKHDMDVLPEVATERPYASLKIKVNECTMITQPIFFHFMIDRSGSMSDVCKDGKTKMDHIVHTLTNMLYFFAENECATIYCEIDSFDDKIHKIVDRVMVTKENVIELIQQLKLLYPRNSTNIELALKYSEKLIQKYSESNIDHRISHIFMTDGDATVGNTDTNYLACLVSPIISSTFIAFGIDHNAGMMNKLGKASKNSSNWLIENLENAGLVYGEILNNELYIGAEDVVISIQNGLIYDYHIGEFSESLEINNLITQTEKNYHILLDPNNIDSCVARVRGVIVETGEIFEEYIPLLPNLMDPYTLEVYRETDLTTQMFRLRTQQLLHEVLNFSRENSGMNTGLTSIFSRPHLLRNNTINYTQNTLKRRNANYGNNNNINIFENDDDNVDIEENNNTKINITENVIDKNIIDPDDLIDPEIKCKEKLTTFHKQMLDYMKINELQEDCFMKGLCDDIYIAIRKIGTLRLQMYVGARETSQGRQQTYNVTDIEFDDDYDTRDDNDNNLASYLLQQSSTNKTYSTPTVINTMRTMSSKINDREIEEEISKS